MAAAEKAYKGKSPRGRLPDLKEIGLSTNDLPDLEARSRKKVVEYVGPPKELDEDALKKYGIASGIQVVIFAFIFGILDIGNFSASFGPYVVFGIFYVCGVAQKLGYLSPLDRWSAPREDQRPQPQWKPPIDFYRFILIFVLAPVRAAAAALVFQKVGHFLDLSILVLVLHQAIDSTWDVIDDYEQRAGAAASGSLVVLASCVIASIAMFAVIQTAGQLLSVTVLWWITMVVLSLNTWTMNNEAGQEPSFPWKGQKATDIKTKFWLDVPIFKEV